jgi:hypothetical protein
MATTSAGLETRILDEGDYEAWRAFVDSAPAGSIYSYPAYLEVLSRAAGGSFRVLAVLKGKEIHGGIALYEREAWGGRVLSGRLLLYYNGFVLRRFDSKYPSVNASREVAVLAALETWLSKERFALVNVRSRHPITDMRPFCGKEWSLRPTYSLLMDLDDKESAFRRIEQNQRRLIRRCLDRGATLSVDEDFSAFYRMHRGTHERKGAPLYLAEPRFRAYFDALSRLGLCRLFHVRLPDGRPVASQLVLLGGHPVTHTVTAAADPEFLGLGTTPFLRWKVSEALAAEGYEGNDLTDASLNEVTRFKSQLGGTLVMNLELRRPGNMAYRAGRRLSAALRRAKGALRRVR